jgi:dethiobiotin synthetase
MLPKTYFITGTDTNAGKTFAMCCLLQAAKKRGLSTAAVKPIAAGGILTSEGLKNEDALQLQKNSTLALSYKEINPLCLEHAIAPHIAAMHEQVSVKASELAEYCSRVIDKKADLTLIEGAGGWMVPLNQQEFISDTVKALNVPVILIVGMKLGCLNHALLTVKALQEDGLILQGWIANQLDPEMPAFEENLDTLRSKIKAPLITTIPWAYDSETSDLGINAIFE